MKDKKVAGRYARAALDAGKSPAELETVGKDLGVFAQVAGENAGLRKILSHPAIPFAQKKSIIGALVKRYGLSPKAARTLEVVLRRGRIDVIAEIASSYSTMLDEQLGRQKVRVASAFALSPADLEGLEKTFTGITGKKAVLEPSVDKSLIGGLVARAGSKVYDGSVSNQLKVMKIKLEQEA